LALAEQTEVMAVQVHGMGCEELVLDDKVDPCVPLRNDGHVLDAGERGVGVSASVG